MSILNVSIDLTQIRVSASTGEDESALPKTLREIPAMPESSAVRTRRLSLDEYDNLFDEPITHLLNGKRWHDPISEKPLLNSTEPAGTSGTATFWSTKTTR